MLDQKFMHKGMALWNAIDSEITPRNEGTLVAKRIALDRMSQGKYESSPIISSASNNCVKSLHATSS